MDIDDSNIVIESEHNTNSEISDRDAKSDESDLDGTTDGQGKQFYYGKNIFK